MKPIKLALIRQSYRDDGGAERFVSRAIEALNNQDLNLTLIARKWGSKSSVSRIHCNPFYIGRLWRDASFVNCVCKAVSENEFDLVQSHERLSCCDIYRAGDGVHREWLTQRSRVLSSFRALTMRANPYHRYILRAEKAMFESEQLRAVICNSKMVRDELLGYFDIPDHKLHVIYSGVDTEHFHPRAKNHRSEVRTRLGISNEQPVFLFVGSGFERKGAGRVVSALKKLPEQAIALIIGDDKHRVRYEKQASDLGLEQQIRFLGKKSDVLPYYGAADAFVLPTLYDPFPNVILEAMASGLPIITSTKSGGSEFIQAGENGFVCDALDIVGLSVSMKKLMDHSTSESMGISARKTVEPYTLDAMGKRLELFYRSMLTKTADSTA
jgi:UDP-glucose:(heptosyl)LPS alpha-1,3-glucosyltransferase